VRLGLGELGKLVGVVVGLYLYAVLISFPELVAERRYNRSQIGDKFLFSHLPVPVPYLFRVCYHHARLWDWQCRKPPSPYHSTPLDLLLYRVSWAGNRGTDRSNSLVRLQYCYSNSTPKFSMGGGVGSPSAAFLLQVLSQRIQVSHRMIAVSQR
jgi:hypothetical protein